MQAILIMMSLNKYYNTYIVRKVQDHFMAIFKNIDEGYKEDR